MTAILGGLVAAFGWGTATLVSSRTTRMIGSQQALAWVMVTGLVITIVAAPVAEGLPSPGTGGALWAVSSGLCSVLGLSMMYRALRIGKVGVVAPIGATEGAFAAVIAVVLLDEHLTRGVAVGLLVVTAGIVLVTFHGRLADLHVRPSVYALVAATIFGFGLVASSRAGRGGRAAVDDPGGPARRVPGDRAAAARCAAASAFRPGSRWGWRSTPASARSSASSGTSRAHSRASRSVR